MTNKQRRFYALSGATFGGLLGLFVFLVGRNSQQGGLAENIGVLLILAALLAIITLFLYLPR